MRLGIVMLAHEPLGRAVETLRYWSAHGCPAMVHVDRKVAPDAFARFERSVSHLSGVRVLADRVTCHWGTWSVVGATLRAAEALLDEMGDVSHVLLVSGACLPLRPPRDLAGFLLAQPETDFIESVDVAASTWSKGGFDRERFQYRFPFCHRSRPWLFDRTVNLQRRLRLRRAPPGGLVPHLGSQWWCLTRETLAAILGDPDRPALERYFRQVWIPDESFFQSMARRHSRRIESHSLTLSRFDSRGMPFVFHDDHAGVLRRSGCFVARKAWPGADGLYRTFLEDPAGPPTAAAPNPAEINRTLDHSVSRCTEGRPGLYNQARFPTRNAERTRSAAPYWVLWGVGDLFDGFDRWLADVSGATVHGHLFAAERAHFRDGVATWAGCLSDSARLRDYNPCGFLTNLLWAGKGMRQCFHLGPADNTEAADFIAGDPNARILFVAGGWLPGLTRPEVPPGEVRHTAIEMHRREERLLDTLRQQWVRAHVQTWSLAEFLEHPVPTLLTGLAEAGLLAERGPAAAPALRAMPELRDQMDRLRDSGLNLTLAGDIACPGQDGAAHPAAPKLRAVR